MPACLGITSCLSSTQQITEDTNTYKSYKQESLGDYSIHCFRKDDISPINRGEPKRKMTAKELAQANLEDKSAVVTLNNLHVPQDALATDVASYNRGLQVRINLEYKPQGNTVFLLGTPDEVLETNESLSLPVSPHILTQKLLSISNNKICEFSVKSNGYVQPLKGHV